MSKATITITIDEGTLKRINQLRSLRITKNIKPDGVSGIANEMILKGLKK